MAEKAKANDVDNIKKIEVRQRGNRLQEELGPILKVTEDFINGQPLQEYGYFDEFLGTQVEQPKVEPKVEPKFEQEVVELKPEPKAPIDKIAISITKNGSIVKITRNGKTECQTAITPLDEVRLKNIETEGRKAKKQSYLDYIINEGIDANILDEAKKIGDEFVIREILLNLYKPEREEQLGKYIATLKGEYTEDLPFELNYCLKDIRKSGLSKGDRKQLLDNAKKVRDLNKTIEQETGVEKALGEVQVPILTKAKWLWQDSKIGKWFSKNLLPKGRNDEQHQAEEAIVQEETIQEEKRYTRVEGVERVEVDVAGALSRISGEDEATQTKSEEDYIDLPL